MRFFPLSELPVELVLEILRLAALPALHGPAQSRSNLSKAPALAYTNACTLALVSHRVREAIMPYLLHTVVFSSQKSLNLFLRTLRQQQQWAAQYSTLSIDYARHIRRIWSTECHEPIVNQSTDRYQDYSLLYPIFTKAYDIGLNVQATHLLFEALNHPNLYSNRAPAWNCKRLTIAGDNLRWNALITTAPGHTFLRQLTHLTIWSVATSIEAHAPSGIPDWVYKVPLEFMPNLTHFAFSLDVLCPGSLAMPILVYALPEETRGIEPGGMAFRRWLQSSIPLDSDAFIRYLDLHELVISRNVCWETAFLRGDNNVWVQKPARRTRRA
ncbi:hypothetical protein BDN70DRAFT_926980 [Pholiota conissans]|uniref:Uncharacterized protein n=1 Tax=Pholiota conissans TaxID=109636 RepID=A0A9P6D6U1_9AGAR|nr:hypothetical protein BDN70DRAFT_926980 [Pholiota conissans]